MSKSTDLMRGHEIAQAVVRHMAAEMLTEATERGDLDHEAVTWAVGRMLHNADAAAALKRLETP